MGVVLVCVCFICLVIVIVFLIVWEYVGYSLVVWGLEVILIFIGGVIIYIIWIVVYKNGDWFLE